jgi:hypothetical protein
MHTESHLDPRMHTGIAKKGFPYAYGDLRDTRMHTGIIQSLTICIWEIFAHGKSSHVSPYAKIFYLGITVCIRRYQYAYGQSQYAYGWGSLKICIRGLPVCIMKLCAYGDQHICLAVLEKTNCIHKGAEEEFNNFESFKCNKYHHKWVRDKSEILYGMGQNGKLKKIIVGPVQENWKDIPSGNFFGNYVNEKGRMEVIKFFEDHKKFFPTLWIIVQREAARRVVEVGCEHFF